MARLVRGERQMRRSPRTRLKTLVGVGPYLSGDARVKIVAALWLKCSLFNLGAWT